MPYFVWKGSKDTKEYLEAEGDALLCESSSMSLSNFAGALAHLKQRFSKDMHDTMVAYIVGIVASSLPSNNVLAKILGLYPSIYKSLPLVGGGVVNPWLRPEESCLVIHTCRKGCIAYCNKYAEADVCPKCGVRKISPCPTCKEDRCKCTNQFKSFGQMYFFPLTYRMR